MKILIVNCSDIDGGAARAAFRLHKSLLDECVDSQMLVQSKLSDDFTILGPKNKIQKVLGKIRPALNSLPIYYYKHRTKTLFSPSWLPFSNIVDRINDINPDIVHLHWVAGGMMRIEDITKIKAPIVWSLHDMWAFTGGCHYDETCASYVNSCGNCKVLGSQNSNDLSSKEYQRKCMAFSSLTDINIIGLSQWITGSAKESSLFSNMSVLNIPNGIDCKVFSPINKVLARELLNLPLDKKLVVFGAMEATSDPRKGFKELMASLGKVVSEDVELIVFGSSQPKESLNFNFTTHYLGQLHDNVSLRLLYSAADVLIVPSLQENLSNAIMESLACGTPVVGFSIGGNSDMIEHKKNGYLAQAFDTSDLAKGIEWVLNSPDYDALSKNSRSKILREFDSNIVVKKYISLYHSILKTEPSLSETR